MDKQHQQNLDTYFMTIDENDDQTGVYLNAFTDSPAIQYKAIALSENQKEGKEGQEGVLHKLYDNVKQQITGPCMVPDLLILRQDGDYIYNIVWTEEQIRKIRNKFHKNPQFLFQTNLEHEIPLNNNYIVESWIVEDPKNDKSNVLLKKEYPKGTWMVSYYIPDKNLYEELKAKNVGFSIEGYFGEIKLEKKQKEIINNNNNQIKMKKNLLTTIKDFITFKTVKLMDLPLQDGTVMNVDDTTLICTINGEPAADGDYQMADGSIATVMCGVLVDIANPAEQVLEPADASAQKPTEPVMQSTQDVVQEQEKEKDNQTAIELSATKLELSEIQLSNKNLKLENEAFKLEIEKLKAEIVELGKKPGGEQINVTPKIDNVDITKMTVAQRLAYNVKNIK